MLSFLLCINRLWQARPRVYLPPLQRAGSERANRVGPLPYHTQYIPRGNSFDLIFIFATQTVAYQQHSAVSASLETARSLDNIAPLCHYSLQSLIVATLATFLSSFSHPTASFIARPYWPDYLYQIADSITARPSVCDHNVSGRSQDIQAQGHHSA